MITQNYFISYDVKKYAEVRQFDNAMRLRSFTRIHNTLKCVGW